MTPKAFPTKAAFVIANPKSKLLDQLREVMRVKHYSLRTEEAYGQWVRRYLKFHRDAAGAWRHPRELGPSDVVAFLNHLANVENVAAATQNQALNAISFLYAQVLGMDLGDVGEFSRRAESAGRLFPAPLSASPSCSASSSHRSDLRMRMRGAVIISAWLGRRAVGRRGGWRRWLCRGAARWFRRRVARRGGRR